MAGVDLPANLSGRLARLRGNGFAVLQCAVAAGLAWLVAQRALGHEQPIFACIAAVVALGVSYGQRRRRVLEVVLGVAVGVLVGDLLVAAAGSGAWQISMVVAIAMAIAVLLGAGPLMINQSAVQAVFVTTLVPPPGETLDRWLDAATGGLVALAIAAVVPAGPLRRPLALAVSLLREVAELLREAATAARAHDEAMAHEALEHARGTQARLDALRAAGAEGLEVAATAPWRRQQGSRVRGVVAILEPLDRAVRNVRVLARRVEAALARDEEVPPPLVECVDALGAASLRLAEDLAAGAPLDGVVDQLVAVAGASAAVPRSSLSADVVLAQVRSTTVDLLQVAGVEGPDALRRVRAATGG
jgi:uncharacterized membrane protein YgaE (UPF0421/DUF939 family)